MVNTPSGSDITGIDDDRIYAVMSYLFVLVLVPLLTRRHDPFIYFHAKQGVVIALGFVLAAVAALWSSTVGSLLFLLLFAINIIALVQALLGRRWKIPLIGSIAQRVTL